jgi:hypothetical protein
MSNVFDHNVATRLERLEHQLKMVQLVCEHPDHEDFLLATISVALDLALDELKAISAQWKVENLE